MNQTAFLTTRQVAELLRVSTRVVCLWAELAELPAVRIGRQWRFRRSDIERWIETKRNVTGGDAASSSNLPRAK